ncbi:MAG: hypothetical protein V1725_04605 [archaeon]
MNVLLLLITIVVEFFIIWLFLRKNEWWLLLYAVLINCLTWPLAMLVFSLVPSWYLPFYLIIELFVALAEWPLLKLLTRASWKRAALIAFCANIVTAIIGFLLLNIQ